MQIDYVSVTSTYTIHSFSKNCLPGILCIDDSTVNVDFVIIVPVSEKNEFLITKTDLCNKQIFESCKN